MAAPDNAIEVGGFVVWIDDEIICIQSKGIPATGDMVTELAAATRDLIDGVPMPVLFDFRKWVEGGSVAWNAIISDALPLFSRIAFVVDAESSPQMARYPQIITRLLIPADVFTDEIEALAFLLEQD